MKHVSWILLFILIILGFPQISQGKIGVGVGTGKIVVDQELKPGTIYTLPSITVFNTGDVEAEYGIRIAYHNKQPELLPERDWFIFSPKSFRLKGGESQDVSIKLNLPIRTEPGKYFAYVEGFPNSKSADGTTRVGIAAATKLYFTVVPGSALEGIYFKALSLWREFAPWPQRIAGATIFLLVVFIAKRYLNIEINLRKPHTDKK